MLQQWAKLGQKCISQNEYIEMQNSCRSLLASYGHELSQNKIKTFFLSLWKFYWQSIGCAVLQSCKIILENFPVPKKLQRWANKSCLRCQNKRGSRYRRSILRNPTFQKRQLFNQQFPNWVYWQISRTGKNILSNWRVKIF